MTLEKKGQGLSNGSKKALYCTKNAGSWLVYDDLTDVISYLPSSPITVGT